MYNSVAATYNGTVIDLYLDVIYDESEAIKRLLPQKLKDQFTFKTECAIALLEYKAVIEV